MFVISWMEDSGRQFYLATDVRHAWDVATRITDDYRVKVDVFKHLDQLNDPTSEISQPVKKEWSFMRWFLYGLAFIVICSFPALNDAKNVVLELRQWFSIFLLLTVGYLWDR